MKKWIGYILVLAAIIALGWGGWQFFYSFAISAEHGEEMKKVYTAAYGQETQQPGSLLSKSEIDLAALRKENSDCVGWVSIDGTALSYPVMHTPAVPEFYLDHGFEKQENAYGMPFLDGRCTLESDNLIIYGHHMGDGSMFSSLWDYQEKPFFKAHPTIRFQTQGGSQEYLVAAVIKTSGTVTNDGDSIYSFTDIEDWSRVFDTLRLQSLYDTENVPCSPCKILTLSTCEYSQPNGRLAIVAVEQKN